VKIVPIAFLIAAAVAVLPHVASAQVPPASLAGTIVLPSSYPGDLRIDCTKIVLKATTTGVFNTTATATTIAVPVADSTRTCNWRFERIARGQVVITTNTFPIADYISSTPVIVNGNATGRIEIQMIGTPTPLVVAITPAAAFPTPTPAPAAAILTVVSGGAQTRTYDPRLFLGATNDFIVPLVAKLTTPAGVPIAGAPVVFSCPPAANISNCSLQQDFMTGVTKTVTVTTDTNGIATLARAQSGVSVAVLYAYTSALPNGNMPPMPITATYKNVSTTFTMTLVKGT
jgi:hypothetical protein